MVVITTSLGLYRQVSSDWSTRASPERAPAAPLRTYTTALPPPPHIAVLTVWIDLPRRMVIPSKEFLYLLFPAPLSCRQASIAWMPTKQHLIFPALLLLVRRQMLINVKPPTTDASSLADTTYKDYRFTAILFAWNWVSKLCPSFTVDIVLDLWVLRCLTVPTPCS